MAGGKETPRQKMVGLMYLVLMALLAMNVSKDILQSFVVLNEGLEKASDLYDLKSKSLYSDFNLAYTVNPVKVKPYWEKAQETQKLSRELIEHVNKLKVELIRETEQIPQEVADTISLAYVDKKDNYDDPTRIMIGEKEDASAGKANELKLKLEAYKNDLLNMLDEKSRKDAKIGLNTSDQRNTEGKLLNWELFNFYHTPLAASITILSELQNEIKDAEYYIVDELYKNTGSDQIPFDTVAAKVFPTSNYVLLGDKYNANIFLAGFSKTQNPDIYIGEYDTINHKIATIADTLLVENGMANYSIDATKEGMFSYEGAISLRLPSGAVRNFPFKSDYIVAKPNLVVAPTQMNVFYKGPDNPVDISVPGVPSENITATITGGNRIRQTANGKYIVNVNNGSPSTVYINVSATMPDGSVQQMGQKEFRVKNLPQPYARISNIKGAGKMTKGELLAQLGIIPEYDPTFEFKLPLTVKSFKMEYTTRTGTAAEIVFRGPRFSSEREKFETVVNSLTRGKKVIFSNISAENSIGQPYILDPIVVEIK